MNISGHALLCPAGNCRILWALMCLTIPVRVKEIRGSMAEVELGGVITEVSVLFTPEREVGDELVMHARGCAISVLDTEQAEETLQLFRQIAEYDAAE